MRGTIGGSSPDICNLCLHNQSLHRFCRTLLHGLAENISLAVQEMCIPAHVSESLEIWLAQQCDQFGQGVPTAIPAGHPSPFLQTSGESIPLPRSPFQNVPLAEERPSVSSAGGPSPMQVSHPFVTIPDVTEGVQCATPAPQSSNHTLLNFPEGGPVHLTRFVECLFLRIGRSQQFTSCHPCGFPSTVRMPNAEAQAAQLILRVRMFHVLLLWDVAR